MANNKKAARLTIHNTERLTEWLNRHKAQLYYAYVTESDTEYIFTIEETQSHIHKTPLRKPAIIRVTIDRELRDGKAHLIIGDTNNSKVFEGDYEPRMITPETIGVLMGFSGLT